MAMGYTAKRVLELVGQWEIQVACGDSVAWVLVCRGAKQAMLFAHGITPSNNTLLYIRICEHGCVHAHVYVYVCVGVCVYLYVCAYVGVYV